MAASSRAARIWRRIRRVWMTLGIGATVIFVAWSLIAYRANDEARAAMASDAAVTVSRDGDLWRFDPVGAQQQVGLLFVPWALVDPRAYAPLVRAAAAAGYPSVLMTLPRRGAFGGADDPAIPSRVRGVMHRDGGPDRWILAGHSRGAVIVSALASKPLDRLAGAILIGTSHPRDVDLAKIELPITKIVGSRDGLASAGEVEANAHLLPPHTQWVRIDGGNHSQFGWYGFQPGDHRATIDSAEQHRRMIEAVLLMLRAVGAPVATPADPP